jgi:sulfhydrogenase subunit gamma (sulfur reductase)
MAITENETTLQGQAMLAADPYRPWEARITSITPLTETEKLYELRLCDDRVRAAFKHKPGQFVMISILGVGEAPIAICSSPAKSGFFELTIRKAGAVTSKLDSMQCGDIVGIRGPYGHPFPYEEMKGNDILCVAGGTGIAPLRSLINNIHDERDQFGKVVIVYGSRNEKTIMFRDQFEMWRHRSDFELYLPLSQPDEGWTGEVGYAGDMFKYIEVQPKNTFGAICGPPVMYASVIEEMRKKGIDYDRIYMSFERHMKCGMGKCGHCQVAHQYCCQDGPVFNYWDAQNMQNSI